jgi:hypothetical protein
MPASSGGRARPASADRVSLSGGRDHRFTNSRRFRGGTTAEVRLP